MTRLLAIEYSSDLARLASALPRLAQSTGTTLTAYHRTLLRSNLSDSRPARQHGRCMQGFTSWLLGFLGGNVDTSTPRTTAHSRPAAPSERDGDHASDLGRCSCNKCPRCFSALHVTPLATSPAAFNRSLSAACQFTLLYRVATITSRFQCVQRTEWASQPQSRCPTHSNSIWNRSKVESTSSRCLGRCTGKTSTLPSVTRCLSCKQ